MSGAGTPASGVAVETSASIISSQTASSSVSSLTTTTSSSSTSSLETSSSTVYSQSATTSLSTSSLLHSSTTVSSTSSTPSGTLRSTSDHASQSSSSGSRYSTGTLAGSIVGSFLGGFIIAFLVAFLLLRRRKRVSNTDETRKHSPSETLGSLEDPSRNLSKNQNSAVSSRYEGISYVSPNVVTWGSFELSPYVPDPADDNTVCMRIQTFFDQASLHIDNYYSRPDSALRPNQEDNVRIGDYESPFLGTPLASLLSNPRTQRTVLTHVLIHSLLQSIRPGNQARSLLPACYRLDQETRENESRISADDRAAFAWRMLASHIYTRGQTSQSTDLAVNNEDITKIADDFNRTFAPYGDPRFPKTDRLAHIHTVFREASRLGIWLFSQPCSFEFHWSMVSKNSNQITLLPSVVKVYDEQGRHLAVPQRLLDETKAQI
ncbi:uncharacterized protein N7496_011384 [Penicillium cataractarum]|uniref:Uncharacterized protein n=1 Tax=Penicillium cataractarum TaxID=2100454 RepID=A0A9W9RF66_9EURO|nr:uncharacterized protein N7496_011384 [Penicillium cataractarum]KAJ5358971.1 hypothetical protein N7496_011384 [Penicillium cataractarum]